MSYSASISWGTIPDEVINNGSHSYTCLCNGIDASDPGYETLAVGYYLVDNVGDIYEITAINVGGTATRITVLDIQSHSPEKGPTPTQLAYIYESIDDSKILAPVYFNELYNNSRDQARQAEQQAVWEHRGVKLVDTVVTTTENVTTINLANGLIHTVAGGNEWQGGSANTLEIAYTGMTSGNFVEWGASGELIDSTWKDSDFVKVTTAQDIAGIKTWEDNAIFEGNIAQDPGYSISTDQIKAADSGGLLLTDDGNDGIFIEDGGYIGIGTVAPDVILEIAMSTSIGEYFRGHGVGDNSEYRYLSLISSSTTNVGDTHTFKAISSTGVLAFSNGIGENMRIAANGNVGIGTTSPQTELHVIGDATVSDKLYVTNKIGIGTTSLTYPLTISGSPPLTLWEDPAFTNPLSSPATTNNIGYISRLSPGNGGMNMFGISNLATASGYRFTGIIGVSDPANTTPVIDFRAGRVVGGVFANLNATDMAYKFGGLSGVGYLTILGSGNVGIGTITPNTTLDVTGTLSINGTTNTDTTIASFLNPVATTAGRVTSIVLGEKLGGGSSCDLSYVSDSATPPNARIILGHYGDSQSTQYFNILKGGNVGIKKTNPSYALDVNGTGRFTEAFLLDSTFGFSTAGIITIDRILDEDTFASNSNTALITQQSAKNYIDANLSTGEYLDYVIGHQDDGTLDPTLTLGYRYIVEDVSACHTNFKGTESSIGDWITAQSVDDMDIVEWDGSDFIKTFDSSAAGAGVTVTVGTDKNGASDHQWYYSTVDNNWKDRGAVPTYTAGNGLTLAATSFSIDTAITVDLSTAQDLTNKTFIDNTTWFEDNTTSTKKMQFQLSGITTATTRTLTVPDANGTIFLTSNTFLDLTETPAAYVADAIVKNNGAGNALEFVTIASLKDDFNYWTLTGSDIYYNNGNVGIGLTTPSSNLHIYDTLDCILTVEKATNYSSVLGQITTGGYLQLKEGTAGTANVMLRSYGYSYFLNDVGIGTTSPSTALDVNGIITATGGTSTNWNTAYGWGDWSHTTLAGYGISDTKTNFNTALSDGSFIFVGDAPTAHNQAWSTITSTPTTLSGYGITDAYTKTEGDNKYLLNTTDTLTGDLTVNNENSESSLNISRGGADISVGGIVGNLCFLQDFSGSPTEYGSINVYAGLSAVRGSMDFSVKSTSGNSIVGMTLYGTNTGVKVGIGTTSPATALEVTGIITATSGTSTQWNTAYGWGDWSHTTLSGYGISDTKANFNTALSDGSFIFVGDAPTSHTHAHVDTTGKQGGTTAQYYHLTSAQHTLLTSYTQTEVDLASAVSLKHTAITLAASATTGGLSLSTQEISFRAATNALTGYATAAHITAIEANTAHLTATGASHTYIDQSVVSGAKPIFDNDNMSGNISIWTNNSGYLTTLAHNNNTGLQGGTTAEYYHLTSAQHTLLTTYTQTEANLASAVSLKHAESHTIASHSDTLVTGAQLTTLQANTSGTNTGDQTSIVGISGTKTQFDTACSDGDFMYIGDAPTAHTIASHSDTTATGAELETLTDGSNADALHIHSSSISDLMVGRTTPASDGGSISGTPLNNSIRAVIVDVGAVNYPSAYGQGWTFDSSYDTRVFSLFNDTSAIASGDLYYQVYNGSWQGYGWKKIYTESNFDIDDYLKNNENGTLNGNLEVTGQQWSETTTLTDATTIATNCDSGNVFKVTLGGNRTLGAPTNLKDGGTYIWRIVQDGTGTRTLAFSSVFKFPDGANKTVSSGSGDIDLLTGVSDGTNIYVVLQTNFS